MGLTDIVKTSHIKCFVRRKYVEIFRDPFFTFECFAIFLFIYSILNIFICEKRHELEEMALMNKKLSIKQYRHKFINRANHLHHFC